MANMTNACARVIQMLQGVGTILILFGFGSGGKTAWRLTRQSWQKLERKLNLVRLNRASHKFISVIGRRPGSEVDFPGFCLFFESYGQQFIKMLHNRRYQT